MFPVLNLFGLVFSVLMTLHHRNLELDLIAENWQRMNLWEKSGVGVSNLNLPYSQSIKKAMYSCQHIGGSFRNTNWLSFSYDSNVRFGSLAVIHLNLCFPCIA